MKTLQKEGFMEKKVQKVVESKQVLGTNTGDVPDERQCSGLCRLSIWR